MILKLLTARLKSHPIDEDLSMGTPEKSCPDTKQGFPPGLKPAMILLALCGGWNPLLPPQRRRPVPSPQRAKIARRGPQIAGDPGLPPDWNARSERGWNPWFPRSQKRDLGHPAV